jgi:hypothetical protein
MPSRHSAFKGLLAWLLLDTLRKEGKPMNVYDMTLRVMMARGMNNSDRRLCRLISKRVGASLRNMRARGVVYSRQGPSQCMICDVLRQQVISRVTALFTMQFATNYLRDSGGPWIEGRRVDLAAIFRIAFCSVMWSKNAPNS